MRFGIRSQEAIDLGVLLDRPSKQKGTERRAIPRKTPALEPGLALAVREEKSRRIARYLDWGLVAIAGVVAGGLLASGAGTVLKRPIERAEAVLAQKRR